MTPLAARVTAALAHEPLADISTAARTELDALVADPRELEDLPGRWQAAILQAESGAPAASAGGCCHGG